MVLCTGRTVGHRFSDSYIESREGYSMHYLELEIWQEKWSVASHSSSRGNLNLK